MSSHILYTFHRLSSVPCCQIHECFLELLTSGRELVATASWDDLSVDIWLSAAQIVLRVNVELKINKIKMHSLSARLHYMVQVPFDIYSNRSIVLYSYS